MKCSLSYLGPLLFDSLEPFKDRLDYLLVSLGTEFFEFLIDEYMHLLHRELGDLPSAVAIKDSLVEPVQIFQLIAIKPVLTWVIRRVDKDSCTG